MTQPPPRIAVVLPRNMHFGPEAATSIDLCARDFVSASRYRTSTTVIAERVDAPFAGFDLKMYPKGDRAALRQAIAEVAPDLIVMHSHVPTGVRIARQFPRVPVIVHRHNYIKPPSNPFSALRHRWRFHRLAGLIFVSHSCEDHFTGHWRGVRTPTFTVYNALDMGDWHPREAREKVIAYTGRAHPLKGGIELAEALSTVLAERPDWSAHLLVSRAEVHPEIVEAMRDAVAPVADRVRLETNRPFAEVVSLLTSAAVAVVPTLNDEPFGRAALEAMAGGAALVSSMNGGLAEVSGDTGLSVAPMGVDALATAIARVADDDALREDLARRGRERALELYDIHPVTRSLDDVYDRVLAR
ncbi:MAG: glycosyltransferase family 4 protein [Pseudomonadota bacterium]